MEGKKDVDYKSPEYINNLLRRINAEVGAVIAENVEEIQRKYGTPSPTVEQILSKLYEKSAGSVEKALAIKVLLTDVSRWRKLPLPLIMYNIGVLRSSLSSPTDVEDMPLEFGPHTEAFARLSDQEKGYLRSELGKESINIRWKRSEEALEKAKEEAKKRWLEWKQKGGKKIYHNKMVNTLLDAMPELKEAGVTRRMLIETLKPIAREIDPTLVFGVKIEK